MGQPHHVGRVHSTSHKNGLTNPGTRAWLNHRWPDIYCWADDRAGHFPTAATVCSTSVLGKLKTRTRSNYCCLIPGACVDQLHEYPVQFWSPTIELFSPPPPTIQLLSRTFSLSEWLSWGRWREYQLCILLWSMLKWVGERMWVVVVVFGGGGRGGYHTLLYILLV